jgi:hypothetical protein
MRPDGCGEKSMWYGLSEILAAWSSSLACAVAWTSKLCLAICSTYAHTVDCDCQLGILNHGDTRISQQSTHFCYCCWDAYSTSS